MQLSRQYRYGCPTEDVQASLGCSFRSPGGDLTHVTPLTHDTNLQGLLGALKHCDKSYPVDETDEFKLCLVCSIVSRPESCCLAGGGMPSSLSVPLLYMQLHKTLRNVRDCEKLSQMVSCVSCAAHAPLVDNH